jgi:hypothetical protein
MRRLTRLVLASAVAIVAAAPAAQALEPRSGVVLRTLDKITGNSRDVSAKVGQSLNFGPLSVTVRACYQSPPEDAPEAAAFLEIRTSAPVTRGLSGVSDQRREERMDEDPMVFSGWMFASTPGINALEYPTYDVWVISCSG